MKSSSWSRRVGIAIAAAGVIGVIVLAWYGTRPGPMAFVTGKTVALSAYTGYPTGVPADLPATDIVARGRYLTEAADCEACHTAKDGKPFAGGLAFRTPFGTMYSPNITPDISTGIGGWTDAEFLKAVHEGIGRAGKRLYPAFPYPAYTYLTDDDVLAIKGYLSTLAPVTNVPPPNELSFPFNQRWLMIFWSGLFNPNQRFMPRPEQSAEWNRGAYLAEALAHCGDCHTPRNLLQALDNERKFSGAVVDGWRAYNISSDSTSGIGAWNEAELAQYLSTGHAEGRGTASGPMAEAVTLSFEKLTASDIRALVVYVRSVPAFSTPELPAPKHDPAPTDPKQGLAAEVDPHGKQIFEGACASCHSWTGISPLESRATLIGSRSVNDPTAINVAQIVLSGTRRPTANSALVMPAFGAAYSDREIAAVANYVTARFGAKPSAITAEEVAKLRATQ